MINIRVFKSVRARLLAIMALVIFPIAVVSLVLASATYQSVTKSIIASQKRASVDYEIRTRVWFVGAIRTLSSVAMLLSREREHGLDCNLSAQEFLEANPAYNAIYLRFEDDSECSAHRTSAQTSGFLSNLVEAESRKPFIKSLPVLEKYGDTRLDAVIADKSFNIVVYQNYKFSERRSWKGVFLIDPKLLEGAYRNGRFDEGDIALVNDKGSIVATTGSAGEAADWFPQQMLPLNQAHQWRALARNGRMTTYSNHPMVLPGLAILARYDDNARQAASIQFLVLCITPLLTLALLFLTYARAIQGEVIRWINDIRAAALARTSGVGRNILAPVNPEMPIELRSVSEAFNQMVKDATGREGALLDALQKNEQLIRELHHRVKNSLQVIQSYLALTRRHKHHSDQMQIMETEARVQVLSTSYRIALSEGIMRPVPIKLFIEEIARSLSSLFNLKKSKIVATVETTGWLEVDRVIPLGLAIVEAVLSALSEQGESEVTINCREISDEVIELAIATSGEASMALPRKIMSGLAVQMAATDEMTDLKDILRWRFAPKPSS